MSQALAQDAPALVVDDATTANDSLVQIAVEDPGGFLPADQTLLAPEGATISVLAGDLERPRFMAFDAAGNLFDRRVVTGGSGLRVLAEPFRSDLAQAAGSSLASGVRGHWLDAWNRNRPGDRLGISLLFGCDPLAGHWRLDHVGVDGLAHFFHRWGGRRICSAANPEPPDR